MDTKFIFALLVLIVGSVKGTDDEIEIVEEGEHFAEKVSTGDKVITYKVPSHRHGKLASVKLVVDPETGYEFANLPATKECFLRKSDKDEPSLAEVKKAVKVLKHSLPKSGERRMQSLLPKDCEDEFEIVEGLENAAEKYCVKGYQKRCMQVVEDKKETEKKAVEIAIKVKGDTGKRALLREFLACEMSSSMVIMSCDQRKLEAECHFRTSFCAYKLRCPLQLSTGYWYCKYTHDFSKVKCCDFKCKA
ncbi:uncharacterized protein LOC130649623 [Hydractinia symbiolongicarpus]|uniref:uncharacterized protein LOC130649623 n=1 Tax=Hydractinia symbiolongicarpus TaxID=13093 RepID=UPI00254A5416|nr:uncharacterized protein LOC130649623 [Hydractinia symbiolongicarpus]